MEYLAVWTNASYMDKASSKLFSLDLECHSDPTLKNEFRLELPDRFFLEEGAVFYIDGTQWGGVVRERETDTRKSTITWIGSTWHGLWSEKVLVPDSGQERNSFSGTVSGAIADLIERLGLDGLFEVGDCPSESVNHVYTRYPYGWEALQEVLASVGMRPTFTPTHHPNEETTVLVGAVSSDTGEVRGAVDLGMRKSLRPPNHIIGLGKGQGVERVVIHRYADASGNISGLATFTGVEDRTIRYESPDSEYEDLLEQIDERLADAQEASDISLYAKSALGIGDRVSAFDERVGESVFGTVTECVAKASRSYLTCTISTE